MPVVALSAEPLRYEVASGVCDPVEPRVERAQLVPGRVRVAEIQLVGVFQREAGAMFTR